MLSAWALTTVLKQGLSSCGMLSARNALPVCSHDAFRFDASRRFLSSPTDGKPDHEPTPEASTSGAESASSTPTSLGKKGAGSTESSGSSSGLRRLSEVLGHEIEIKAQPSSADETSDDPLSMDFTNDPEPVQNQTMEPDPAQEFVDPKFGFAVVGGVIPQAETNEAGYARHPRVHPHRTFQPGQAYKPQDLNPFSDDESGPARFSGRRERRMPTPAEVRSLADFKNVQFLERFLSPAGRLLPRRETKLPVTLHRHVMRQIKIARTMGLIAGEARLDKLHVRKMRELGIVSLDSLKTRSSAENSDGSTLP